MNASATISHERISVSSLGDLSLAMSLRILPMIAFSDLSGACHFALIYPPSHPRRW
jgi:hypothetical protein